MTDRETTPPAITRAVLDFVGALGAEAPRFVDVVPDRLGTFGSCWRGVDHKVSAVGGTRVCGWTVWEMADTYLTAEFHAVWRDPDGNLSDITPKPDGERRIVFAPDPAYASDFDFYKRPNNRLYPAYDPGDVKAIASERIASFTQVQLRYEGSRAAKAVVSLLDRVISKLPRHPRHLMIDDFIAVVEELHSLAIVLPEGTVLPPSARAVSLARRQTALKAALRI